MKAKSIKEEEKVSFENIVCRMNSCLCKEYDSTRFTKKREIKEMQRIAGKRNKNYIETLERKISELEAELQKALSQITMYKAKEHLYQTGDRSCTSELIKTQEYIKQKGPEIVKKEDSHTHLISYLSSKYGANGSERRRVIKHAFKVIFDNIVPDIHKIFIYNAKRAKEIPKEEYSKTMKKIRSTKKALTELNEEDRIFYEFISKINLSKEQKKLFKEKSIELDSICQKYKKLIKELIIVRKDLLELGGVLKTNIGSQAQTLSQQQLLSFIEHFKNVEHSKYLKFHYLWDIKKKKSIQINTEEVDLTATDEDNYQEDSINDEIDLSIIQAIKEEYKIQLGKPISQHDFESLHEDIKFSKIEDIKNKSQNCRLKSPTFERDILSVENNEFLLESNDSEIVFLAQNQYSSFN